MSGSKENNKVIVCPFELIGSHIKYLYERVQELERRVEALEKEIERIKSTLR